MCAVYDEETWLYLHDFMHIGALKWCNIWPFVFHFQTVYLFYIAFPNPYYIQLHRVGGMYAVPLP